jgi:hypothetical protein
VVAGLAMALVGCSSTNCSSIGCASSVTLRFGGFSTSSGQLKVHTCLDESCADHTIADPTQPLVLDPASSRGADESLTVGVTQGTTVLLDGSATVRLTKSMPNGPKCGPICYSAAIAVAPSGLTQTA